MDLAKCSDAGFKTAKSSPAGPHKKPKNSIGDKTLGPPPLVKGSLSMELMGANRWV